MRKTLLFALIVLPVGSFAQQPTKAEIDKMIKDAQQQAEKAMNDPNIKKHIENPAAAMNETMANQYSVSFDKNFSQKKLPPKDTARINLIPKKGFSLTELNSFLIDLYQKLSKKLSAGAVSSANTIAVQLGNDPNKLEAAAFLGMNKGALEEALLLITKAATLSSGDGLLLSNTGAILDMSGLSEAAVPILRTVVRYDPQNAIALNNLGQAFISLGLADSATYYLGRCLSLSSQHPEANNTLGFIEFKKGNKTKALQYYENSIRGGFTLTAYDGLKNIKDDYKIKKLVSSKVKIPEYFNKYKYSLPPQCKNVDEATKLKLEHETYRKLMSSLKDKYMTMHKEAGALFQAKGLDKIINKAKQRENPVRPFQVLGRIMLTELMQNYFDDFMLLDKFNKDNRQQYKQMEAAYEAEYKPVRESFHDREEKVGEGNGDPTLDQEICDAVTEVKNKYLPKLALINEEWQSRNLLFEKKYFDERVFWTYISSWDDDEFRQIFSSLIMDYLNKLSGLCQSKFLEPCELPEEEIEEPEEPETKKPECPFDIQVPFFVGKLEMNCEKFSFAAGEGALFKYEKSFVTKQSTFIVGIGWEIYKLEKEIGGIKGGAGAGMNMSLFFTADNSGHFMDGGMQLGAKAEAGVEFEGKVERVAIKKELSKIGGSVGYRIGIMSGISFDEGPLKGLLNPQEKQINKNVNPFQPPKKTGG